MVKIQIGKKKKVKKGATPKGVTPKKAAAPEQDPALTAAEEAVETYRQAHSELVAMREDFGEQFPEAAVALQEIKQQEDVVVEAIEAAKLKVRAAKETVGDFVCQRKWSQPTYNGKEMMKIVSGLENSGEVLEDLARSGIIESLGLSKGALSFIAGRPEYSELFQEAFEDKKEKTPAITVPKI